MLNISRLAHAAFKMKTDFGNIYIDPFRVSGEPGDADYIFVSHEHYDHFSSEDIKKIINPSTVLIGPDSVTFPARKQGLVFKDVLSVQPGGRYKAGALAFETVPAYNLHKPFHPRKNGGVGYILRLGDETVYFAGDTDAIEELLQVKCTIALLPIGGTFTMNAEEAANAANRMKPREVIPMHYGSIPATASAKAAEVFKSQLLPGIKCTIL